MQLKEKFFSVVMFLSLTFINIEGMEGKKPIVLISIPKAGTHLLRKCIELITKRNLVEYLPEAKIPEANYHLSSQDILKLLNIGKTKYWSSHLMYTPERATLLKSKNIKKFFIYRDPRAVIISGIFYMQKLIKENKTEVDWSSIAELTMDDMIADCICFGRLANGNPPTTGIFDLYTNKYLPWIKALPDLCVIRFEDLVGSSGGGADDMQLSTVKKIATHLGVELTNNNVVEIARSLFGGTSTFRRGKINSWQDYFSDDLKKLFKDQAQGLLKRLGYEKDSNW